MSKKGQSYRDIPGTFVFDAQHSRAGYHLNMFMMSLSKESGREKFKTDERAYLDNFKMTEAQKQAVMNRDWNRMLELGGNVYYTLKLAACDEMPYELNYATMAGVSREDFRAMMLSGGRDPQGNLYNSDWEGGD